MACGHALTMTVFLLLGLLVEAQAAYGNQGQYPQSSKYGPYGALNNNGNNGRAMDYRVDNSDVFDGRRRNRNRQQGEKESEHGTFQLDEADLCDQMCEFECEYIRAFKRGQETGGSLFCAKLRPPPKALHEKFVDSIGRMGLFEYIVGGVIVFAIVLCIACSCYQCCCKGNNFGPGGRRRTRSYGSDEAENGQAKLAAINGGGTISSGMSPEKESLTQNSNNIPHIDDRIQADAGPLPQKTPFNTGGINGVHHHHNQQHAQYGFARSHSGGGGFGAGGSREQSIV